MIAWWWWLSVLAAFLLGVMVTLWIILETGWHPETLITHTRLVQPVDYPLVTKPSLEEINHVVAR